MMPRLEGTHAPERAGPLEPPKERPAPTMPTLASLRATVAPAGRSGAPGGALAEVPAPGPAPAAPPPVQPEQPARVQGVKVRATPPTGYAPAPAQHRGHAGVRRVDPVDWAYTRQVKSRTFPKKLGIGAVLVGIAVLVARAYLPGGSLATFLAGGHATAVGAIAVKTEPAGARILLDGRAVGESPMTLASIPPGRHELTLTSANGSVIKTVVVAAGQTLNVDVATFSGWLSVSAPFVVTVSERGRVIGTTEHGQLMLTPGRHHLVLTNADLDYKATRDVEITAGEVTSIRLPAKGR
jgi:PEGA domain